MLKHSFPLIFSQKPMASTLSLKRCFLKCLKLNQCFSTFSFPLSQSQMNINETFKEDDDKHYDSILFNKIQTPFNPEQEDKKTEETIDLKIPFLDLQNLDLMKIIEILEYSSVLKNEKNVKLNDLFQVINEKKNEINSSAVLTKILWIVAKSNEELSKKFIENLNPTIQAFQKKFSPKELCIIFWSFSKLHIKHTEFLEGFIKMITSQKNILRADDYLNLLYGLMNMKLYDRQTFNEIFKISKKELHNLLETGQSQKFLANLSWCLVSLDEPDKFIWQKILKNANSQIRLMKPKEINQFLWSLLKLKTLSFAENFQIYNQVIIKL